MKTKTPTQTQTSDLADDLIQRQNAAYSLADTRRSGLNLQLNACSYLVGLGTTGTGIVDAIIRRIVASTGDIPDSIDYLTIDGASNSRVYDEGRHRVIGLNGCGTDPNEGRAAIIKAYADLRQTIDQAQLKLRPGDSRMPAAAARRTCIEAWIFAGNGGSSGGMQSVTIDLLNDVMKQRRIANPRVNGVFLGADMPMQDANRIVTQSQREVVSQTAYLNFARAIANHMNPVPQQHHTPGGSTFTVPAGHDLWSAAIMDQSNGFHQFGTTEELIEMVSYAYFAAICTHCSTSVEDRVKDLEKMGDTARAMCVSKALK